MKSKKSRGGCFYAFTKFLNIGLVTVGYEKGSPNAIWCYLGGSDRKHFWNSAFCLALALTYNNLQLEHLSKICSI